jgi:membrane protein implicated in regulation of membrane protease activity
MPLSFTNQPKISFFKVFGSKIRNTFLQIFAFLRPDVFFGIFLLAAIIVAFVKINWGFYVSFSVFIVLYFIERISKIIWSTSTKKQQDKDKIVP